MEPNSVVYTAVYDDLNAALADLDAVDRLHHEQLIGKYAAAVIAKEDGKPRIVRRMDRPRIRVVPELLGGGTLPRRELRQAAEKLNGREAGLLVVGEQTLDEWVEKALARAANVAKRAPEQELEDKKGLSLVGLGLLVFFCLLVAAIFITLVIVTR